MEFQELTASRAGPAIQVDDDIALLDLMLNDLDQAPPEFRPAARWMNYSERFRTYLYQETLRDFRSRTHEKGTGGAVLASFGALDLNPNFSRSGGKPEEMYHVARSSFRGKTSRSIEEIPASRVGNPQGFEIDGNFYTLSWLNYYCRYAFASSFIDFDKQVIVEVGPGSGKQAEMLKKCHPGLTILLFDLPTQLYVCNQFLSKVFEGKDEVVDYRKGRSFERFADIERGKINILPCWKFPILRGETFDVLWNSASFQEMSADEAKRYLNDGSNAQHMFLMHNIKYAGSRLPIGERGVINTDVIDKHKEVFRAEARLALRPETWIYFDSWWTRQSSEHS